jgi:hypothetical protein
MRGSSLGDVARQFEVQEGVSTCPVRILKSPEGEFKRNLGRFVSIGPRYVKNHLKVAEAINNTIFHRQSIIWSDTYVYIETRFFIGFWHP